MASTWQNLRTALGRPRVLADFVSWKAQRLIHREPRIALPGGGFVTCPPKFNDFRGVARQHPTEAEFSTFKQLLSPGCTFVDVGSNIGQMIVLASRTGLPAKLIGFEPTHAYAEAWHRNIELNGVGCAALIQAPCSDEPGVLEFIVNSPMHNRINAGGALDRYADASAAHVKRLPTVTLDGACAALGIDSIGLLKIDVEGAEAKVLRGAVGLLERRAIANIYMEFIPEYLREMGEDLDDYVRFVTSRGFQFFAIDEAGNFDRALSHEDVVERRYPGLNVVARLV